MITLLTWNINNKKTILLEQALKAVSNENKIDIIILQEAYGQFVNTVLSYQYNEIVYPGNGIGSGVRIFLKKNTFKNFSILRTDNKKLVFIHLQKIKSMEEFNIAAVHLHSKVNNSERQQLWKNLPLIQKIKEFEKTSTNNNNTILAGDFNHNPHESDLCEPNMINGVENKELIKTLLNYPISKKKYDFWYNPMWNLLGDYDYLNRKAKVTGTYFRYTEDETPIWNLFDGFIIRPSLVDKVNYRQTKIITKTKMINFLKPFTIKKDESLIKEDLSDHLPVKFSLNIK
ncbi:endonuclease/exonuclease/phosphatase family protein [Flavobacterium sp. DG2-3]|uniref:endonuclease/exonuclease/phosphatase family protein n=1 Tax=Flavobacterium sp. DG2-3 TaxID=3068317 RepID=UPI00273F0849|nr:endonuclease/exonuclease/phosphatase family protein [Flavobacterium sp. DG2-3]MDP5199930.1 endonuclease/exonuclease/phosphatase family protein [Flavobacterium sp. DG2-3]